MERPKRLSASFIRTVKRLGRYGDGRGGHGLSLLVKPMSAGGFSKAFSQRLRLRGKPFNRGLGSYPLVTLAEARQQALVNARIVRRGVDPRVERKREASMPTFEQASDRAIAFRAKGWKPGSRTERFGALDLQNTSILELARCRFQTLALLTFCLSCHRYGRSARRPRRFSNMSTR